MNKKLLAFLGIYSIWVFTAMKYNKKNPSDLSKELSCVDNNCQDKFKIFLNNFVEIHQNLLDDLKQKLLTEENKVKINNFLEDYKIKAEEIISEVLTKWKDYLEEWYEKLENFTNNQINNLNEKSQKDNVDELKEELIKTYNEFKNKLKKL